MKYCFQLKIFDGQKHLLAFSLTDRDRWPVIGEMINGSADTRNRYK